MSLCVGSTVHEEAELRYGGQATVMIALSHRCGYTQNTMEKDDLNVPFLEFCRS